MNGVTRFLSRREKKGKGSPPSKDIYRILHCEEKKKYSREEEKAIQEVTKRLEELEISNIKESHIKYALQNPYSKGDADKALELLRLFHETVCGKTVKFNPVIPMLGAENRNMVTCYIDSLLFAMFARLDSFESMLSVEFPDAATNHLAVMLRFWVNMLRTGKLITVDVVKHIQDALADCGWEDARAVRQQDVSEAFTFITDKLALPLLTLKMDVYHTGKESMDDHRYVRERLLDVAIPEEGPSDGSGVKLEDCLESFFNNKIEVKRLLQRRNTINSRPQLPTEKGASSTVQEVELRKAPTSESVFRRRKMDLLTSSPPKIKEHKDDMTVSYGGKEKEKDQPTAYRKEVLVPAWQFFHLIPWFQTKLTSEGQPTTDAQVAAHFAKRRPVLGICLKRYKITKDGPRRSDTYIDIPLEIRLPHFISDGSEDDGFGSSFSNFKLSLQSVICHRGNSLNAGHYVSIVRSAPHEIRKEGSEADRKCQWIMFDDLAKERVTTVDVRKALKSEVPYLLFYQVQPVDDEDEEEEDYSGRSSSEHEGPPTYAEAIHSTPGTNTEAQNSVVTVTPETSISMSDGQDQIDRDDDATPEVRVGHLPLAKEPLLSPRTASPANSAQSLEQIHSAPPNLEVTVRPRSLDIPRTSQDTQAQGPTRSRMSHESENKRTSIAFTNDSFAPSNATTPFEDSIHNSIDSYIQAKDLPPTSEENSGTVSPPKRRGRRREDGHDGLKEKDKRLSRTSWLNVGSKRIRPKSMPPNDNRNTMSDFMKGIKGAMSKDKLPLIVTVTDVNDTTETAATQATAKDTKTVVPVPVVAETNGHTNGVVTNGTTHHTKEKSKDKHGSVSRRKSLRARTKARLEGKDKDPTTAGEDGDADRQCSLM